MIRRIVGSNQVATPTDQMGTPPDIGKSQMGAPPEGDKTNEQIQSDAGIARSLQQSVLQKAVEQRLQASRLQTELLNKLGSPPDPDAEGEILIDPRSTKAFDPQPEPPLMKKALVDPLHEGTLVDPPHPFETTTAKTNLPPPDSASDMWNKL